VLDALDGEDEIGGGLTVEAVCGTGRPYWTSRTRAIGT
jgi:hypothetical protein